MTDLARRSLILETARRLGVLVQVPPSRIKADMIRWRGIVAGHQAVAPHCPRPAADRRVSNSRAASIPLDQLVPGVWVKYRPRLESAGDGYLYRFVAVVPPGVGVDRVLDHEQMRKLDRHTSIAPTPRFTRVVLGVPGSRRSILAYKVVLMGTLATHGYIVPPEEVPAFRDNRLPSPLPPDSLVSWSWHSSFGVTSCYGQTLAYVPAGESLRNAAPSEKLRSDLIDVSEQDRYLVRLFGDLNGRLMSPAAHLVERGAILESEAHSRSLDENSRNLSVVPNSMAPLGAPVPRHHPPV